MIFHLAIAVKDLEDSIKFYESIGARLGRKYDGYAIFNFYNCQLVIHVDKFEAPKMATMYPKHFGIIFDDPSEFERTLFELRGKALPFFQNRLTRFQGLPAQHDTFFLVDPSNNVIEFKHYLRPEAIFLRESPSTETVRESASGIDVRPPPPHN